MATFMAAQDRMTWTVLSVGRTLRATQRLPSKLSRRTFSIRRRCLLTIIRRHGKACGAVMTVHSRSHMQRATVSPTAQLTPVIVPTIWLSLVAG